MLALPAVTAPAGFIASTAALLACCAYSLVTGLLIAEVRQGRRRGSYAYSPVIRWLLVAVVRQEEGPWEEREPSSLDDGIQ